MADLAWTPITLLWVAYAAGAVGLAALVTRARPITRGNALLLVLLLQQAWQSAAAVMRFAAQDPDLAWTATLAAIPAWLLWPVVAFLAGPLLLGTGPFARRTMAVGAAGALPGLVLLASWPLGPGLVLAPDASRLTDAAAATLFLAFSGLAFTVAVLAREALTTPLPVRRGQLALLAAAFSVEGAYHAAQNAAKLAGGEDFAAWGPAGALLTALSVVPAAAFLAIAAWAAWRAGAAPDPGARRWAWGVAGAIGVSMLTGAVAAPVTPVNEVTDPAGAFHALWDLAALALIVYAGLRYQLFHLERRAKQGVAMTATLALVFVAFTALQEMAEGVLADTEILAGLPAAGTVAAVLVAAASAPLGKAGQAVAQRLFPHVRLGQDYEHQRRLHIYTAALEGALADGLQTPREAASLRRLRAELRIAEDEHDRLETEVRARLAPSPAGPGTA